MVVLSQPKNMMIWSGIFFNITTLKNEMEAKEDMAISSKKALEAANVIVDFCNEQKGCQNCIFRLYGADHWKCHMYAFDLQDVLSNIKAKKKNHGLI